MDTSAASGAPSEFGYVIDALRTAFEEEFQIADRLTAKARQVFALAAGYFTITQTVSFSSFRARDIEGWEKYALLAAAVIAVFALSVAALRATQADRPITTHQFPVWLIVVLLNAIDAGRLRLPPESLRRDPPTDDFLTRGSHRKLRPDRKAWWQLLRPRPKAWWQLLKREIEAPPQPPEIAAPESQPYDMGPWTHKLLGRADEEQSAAGNEEDVSDVVTRDTAPGMLGVYYVTFIQSRRRGNAYRFALYERVRRLATVSVAVTTVELVYSLFARLA